jgi:hypothetical protein
MGTFFEEYGSPFIARFFPYLSSLALLDFEADLFFVGLVHFSFLKEPLVASETSVTWRKLLFKLIVYVI